VTATATIVVSSVTGSSLMHAFHKKVRLFPH
jgi:hypothetical protein